PSGGSRLHTARIGDQYCRYRTAYPLVLWPVAVADARLAAPPVPSGLSPPPKAAAALVLRLRSTGELTFDKMQIDRLRLHLVGDNTLVAPLYDLLFNHVLGVAVLPADKPRAAVYLGPADAIHPVGF